MNRASAEAKTLQDYLTAIMQQMAQRTEEVAISYETNLEAVTVKASNRAEVMMTTLEAAVTSSALLQNELVSDSEVLSGTLLNNI